MNLDLSACERLAALLRARGIVAHVGERWDFAEDHHEPEFWHFHPLENGGVGAYARYDDDSTYDMNWLDPKNLPAIEATLSALPQDPDRETVWDALETIAA